MVTWFKRVTCSAETVCGDSVLCCVCFVLCVFLLLSLFVSQFMCTCTHVHIQGGECVGGGEKIFPRLLFIIVSA